MRRFPVVRLCSPSLTQRYCSAPGLRLSNDKACRRPPVVGRLMFAGVDVRRRVVTGIRLALHSLLNYVSPDWLNAGIVERRTLVRKHLAS